jgi:hypothetical protein
MSNSLGYSIAAHLGRHIKALGVIAVTGLACFVAAVFLEQLGQFFDLLLFGAGAIGMMSVGALLFRTLYLVSGKPDSSWSIVKHAIVGAIAACIALWTAGVAILCGAGMVLSIQARGLGLL